MPQTLPQALALFGAFFVWIAVALTALAYEYKFRTELELRHPELWGSLRSPGIARGLGSFWTKQHLMILWAGRYRRIGDAELTRLGDRARWSSWAMLVYGVGVLWFFSAMGHR